MRQAELPARIADVEVGLPRSGGPEDETPVQVGQVLAGKYRVDRVLGAGGMGVVLAATHLQLLERVALKFLRGRHHVQWTERFLREARATVRLKSEHVAKVLDMGRLESGAPFLVMEFLEGQTLGALLRERGPLQVDETVGYVLQACEGIAEAHGKGIVHRDLKPENLFVTTRVDGSPLVKVLDFGIAKSTERAAGENDEMTLTQTQQTVGSPQYMSPEQLRALPDIDGRADVWALGVVLYECLVGRRPFEAPSFPELLVRIVDGDPARPSTVRAGVPPELDEIVLRCLRKDVEERFASVSDLAVALAPYAPEGSRDMATRVQGVSARASGLPPPMPSSPGRRHVFTPVSARTGPGSQPPWRNLSGSSKRPMTIPFLAAVSGVAVLSLLLGRIVSSGEPPKEASASVPTAVRATVLAPAAPVTPIPPPLSAPAMAAQPAAQSPVVEALEAPVEFNAPMARTRAPASPLPVAPSPVAPLRAAKRPSPAPQPSAPPAVPDDSVGEFVHLRK